MEVLEDTVRKNCRFLQELANADYLTKVYVDILALAFSEIHFRPQAIYLFQGQKAIVVEKAIRLSQKIYMY